MPRPLRKPAISIGVYERRTGRHITDIDPTTRKDPAEKYGRLKGLSVPWGALSGARLGGTYGGPMRDALAFYICADFSNADLSNADLRYSDLRDAKFRGADLRGADLRDCLLSGADFRGADLSGARLYWHLRIDNPDGGRAFVPQLAELHGARFHGANLDGLCLLARRAPVATLALLAEQGADIEPEFIL